MRGNDSAMIPRSTFSGDTRQAETDVDVLTLVHCHRRTAFKDQMVAIDRMAGTTVLACIAVLSIWLVSQAIQMRWLDAPSVTANAALDGRFVAGEPMTVAAVRQLQSKLQVLGFDPGLIDGIRGGRTLDALTIAERKNLPRVSQIKYETAAGLLD
jgi:hypothetical protein